MSVSIEQNSAENLRLRRAIAQAYFLAKWSLGFQLLVNVLMPIIASLVGIAFGPVRPYAAILSLAALGLDVLWFDRRQKALLVTAAKLAEWFDTEVLLLPWNASIAGARPSATVIEHYESAFRARGKSDAKLLDWYPEEASKAPTHQERIICQLTNAQYDGRLRRRYRGAIMAFTIVTFIVLMAIGILANLTLSDFVLTVLVPSTPLVAWSLREVLRQLDTDGPLQQIEENALALWANAREGAPVAECSTRSRSVQDSIYIYRARSPLPIPFLYSLFRSTLETKMNNSARDRLSEIGL